MKRYLSEKAVSLKRQKFFSEPLLATLLRLGWMRDTQVLKRLLKAEVWGGIYKSFQARRRIGRYSPGGV